jgi:tetratricopeptide (TPR) repeat protein
VPAAEKPVELKSPHFVVYSDSGDSAARSVAARAERVRALFARVWPWARLETGAPAFLLVTNKAGARAVLPPGTSQVDKIPGWSTHGPERHYFVLRSDMPDGEVDRSLLSGLSNVVLGQNFALVPLWLSVGVSQLWSETPLRPEVLEFGHQPEWLKWAVRGDPIPLALVLERRSYEGLKPEQRGAFNAACWGFAHWLVVEQSLAANRAAGQFLKLVSEGVDGSGALRQAGLDPARTDAALQAHLRGGAFRAVSLAVPTPNPASWTLRGLSPAEWMAITALYSNEYGRSKTAEAAEAQVREALRLEPGLAVAHEARARCLWRDATKAAAVREALAAALATEPRRASARFLAAYLERNEAEKPEARGDEVDRGLEHAREAVALQPELAPAHAVLADLLLRKNDTAAALTHARRAVQLEPALPAHRLVLARALARSGDGASARRECEMALRQQPYEELEKKLHDLLASLPAASGPPAPAS